MSSVFEVLHGCSWRTNKYIVTQHGGHYKESATNNYMEHTFTLLMTSHDAETDDGFSGDSSLCHINLKLVSISDEVYFMQQPKIKIGNKSKKNTKRTAPPKIEK